MAAIIGTSNPSLDARPLSSSSPAFWVLFLALLGIGFLADAAATAGRQDAGAGVRVELGDMFIEPATLGVPAGKNVVLEVTNRGQLPHDLTMAGGGSTRLLSPGESQAVSFSTEGAAVTLYCSVPGHRSAGMEMRLIALGAPATSAGH